MARTSKIQIFGNYNVNTGLERSELVRSGQLWRGLLSRPDKTRKGPGAEHPRQNIENRKAKNRQEQTTEEQNRTGKNGTDQARLEQEIHTMPQNTGFPVLVWSVLARSPNQTPVTPKVPSYLLGC